MAYVHYKPDLALLASSYKLVDDARELWGQSVCAMFPNDDISETNAFETVGGVHPEYAALSLSRTLLYDALRKKMGSHPRPAEITEFNDAILAHEFSKYDDLRKKAAKAAGDLFGVSEEIGDILMDLL